MSAHLAAAGAVLRRDFQIAASYRTVFVSRLLGVFFSVTLFYYISRLITVTAFASNDTYFAYVVVGLVILQMVTSAISVPMIVQRELMTGTFERLVVSPFGAMRGVLSMLLYPFIQASVVALLTFVYAALVFGLDLRWSTAPLAIPVALLGGIAFAAIGVGFTALLMAFKRATGTTYILAAISIVGGLYFPIALLPDWMEWMQHAQPFTPTVELLRNVLSGTPLVDPAWVLVVKLTGFAAAMLPLACMLLMTALRFSRKRGTLTEF